MRGTRFLSAMVVAVSTTWCAWGAPAPGDPAMTAPTPMAVATFAGGCFWCSEADLEALPGVLEVVSGYAGGTGPAPTYEEVSSGRTDYLEAVQVRYDPRVLAYVHLLEAFWRHVDPTDPGGQFVDRGPQYRTAIFYHDERQRQLAEASKTALAASGIYGGRPIVTEIRPFTTFHPAEAYHQDYHRRNPIRYKFYRFHSGRDRFVARTWGDTGPLLRLPELGPPGPWHDFRKPPAAELERRLDPLVFEVTQREGTERPFTNPLWDEKRPGIYVDVLSGEPLFASVDKFDSGTGWPSFTRPLEPELLVLRPDHRLGTLRIEVRSRFGDNHLGHVFPDGPPPTNLRYCINAAALRFVPLDELAESGYGHYRRLFERKR